VHHRIIGFVVIALLGPACAFAQDAPNRGWVDVNFGVAVSAANAQSFVFTDRVFLESRAFAAAYDKPPTGAEFDFGGGWMFTPKLGIGVSLTGTAHEDVAGLAVTVPHPFFFNSATTAADTTREKLQRGEGCANIQVMIVPLHSRRTRVRLFAGPTYFRYEADMVSDITYSQVATAFSRTNLVMITNYDAVKTEGTGWGFHVGGDVSYFFSRVAGIGAFARYSAGKVSIAEPLSETSPDITVGGFQTGGGLRLRF
jgi:hypothetical protein